MGWKGSMTFPSNLHCVCSKCLFFFCTRRMKYTLNASYSTTVQKSSFSHLNKNTTVGSIWSGGSAISLSSVPVSQWAPSQAGLDVCVCVLWKVLTINTVYFPKPLKKVKTVQRNTIKQHKAFQKGIFRPAPSPFFPLHGMSISYWLAYKCNITRCIWVRPITSGGHFLWTGFIKEKGAVDVSGWIYQPQGRRSLQQVWCTKKEKKEKNCSVQQHSSTHSSGLPPQWTGEWWLLPNWNQTTYKNCGFTPPTPSSLSSSVCLSVPSAPPCFWLQSSLRFIPSHLFQRTKKGEQKLLFCTNK